MSFFGQMLNKENPVDSRPQYKESGLSQYYDRTQNRLIFYMIAWEDSDF